MQPAGGLADDFLEPALDVHMNVLERPREHESTVLDLFRHLIEAAQDLARVTLGDDPAFAQHRRMRLGAADVLGR
jgi:hypothetical protein